MHFFRSLLCPGLLLCLSLETALAQSTGNREELPQLEDAMRVAGELYAQGDYLESATRVGEIQSQLLTWIEKAEPAARRQAQSLYGRLARAHGLLELEGAELEPLPPWNELTERVPSEPGGDKVSFKSHIAPWLVGACGRCHIENRRGEFSLASYQGLMQGAGGRPMVSPGSARGSRLVEVIESGDMPRGGGAVTPEQLASLKLWIDQGAGFDGPDPAAPLSSFASRAENTSGEAPVAAPTGRETVSFARDVAPILLENCNGCHIDGRQASGNLRLDSFSQLLRGGDSGRLMDTAEVDESLILRKVRGQAGQRMPAGGRPPLSDSEIETLATWIEEGAAYDGPNPNMSLASVASQTWAANASHEELFERRRQRAQDTWKQVLPNDTPATAQDDQFYVLGNVPPERAATVLERLQEAAEETRKLLRLSAATPLIRGGMTVFVLKGRYDYSEFGRMTEQRDLPKDWLAHWRAQPLDVYGVLAADSTIDQDLADSLALQIVSGAYMGSLSDTPRWFAEGVARNLVFLANRRSDPRVQAWQRALPAAIQQVESPDKFLAGNLDDEAQGLVGMSLVYFMMDRRNRGRFEKLHEGLRAGQSFEAACTSAFVPPASLVKGFLAR